MFRAMEYQKSTRLLCTAVRHGSTDGTGATTGFAVNGLAAWRLRCEDVFSGVSFITPPPSIYTTRRRKYDFMSRVIRRIRVHPLYSVTGARATDHTMSCVNAGRQSIGHLFPRVTCLPSPRKAILSCSQNWQTSYANGTIAMDRRGHSTRS